MLTVAEKFSVRKRYKLTFLLENRLVLPDREKYDSSIEEEEPKAPLLKNITFFSSVQK